MIQSTDWLTRLQRRLSDTPAGLPVMGFGCNPPVVGRSVAPGLAYGRHRGPAGPDVRHAAVMIALESCEDGADALRPDELLGPDGLYRPENLRLVLTRRPAELTHHGGQICLPGGRIEPGETALQAAVREFEEEMGVVPVIRRRLGPLSSQSVYASNHLVHPQVCLIQPTSSHHRPAPDEVAEIIMISLAELMTVTSGVTASHRTTKSVLRGGKPVGSFRFRAAGFELGGHWVWGATAMILYELARQLQRVVSCSSRPAN